MTAEEFAGELDSILNYNRNEVISGILELFKRQLEETPPPTLTEITEAVKASNLVHRTMIDWANRWVANEVGNRLRCGIWDGTTVDRVFDSIWTEQFDVAIKDRIRSKVYAAIDAAITEKLKQFKA